MPYRRGRHFSDWERWASSIDKCRSTPTRRALDKSVEALLASAPLIKKNKTAGIAETLRDRHRVREFLENGFCATAAGNLATDIEMRFPEHSLFCDIRNNQLSFPDITAADLVLYFQSPEQACELLSGTQDPIAAFMENRLRANGHLIRVFQFFAAFAQPQTPEQ